jgi:hypothetical protein
MSDPKPKPKPMTTLRIMQMVRGAMNAALRTLPPDLKVVLILGDRKFGTVTISTAGPNDTQRMLESVKVENEHASALVN